MKETNFKGAIEGLIFVSGEEGIERKQITEVLEISLQEAGRYINELKEEYENENRGMRIAEYAGQLQFVTKAEHAVYYERLIKSPQHSGLSQAALETLAIIAYKQPITRSEIEEIRGVKTEKPLQTLQAKSLVKETGRAEGTGRAILYGTTKAFLEHFGLKTIKDLPPLPDSVKTDEEEEEADLFFSRFQQSFQPEE
ncbi:SMC-Scp complex subunit ScpB [Fictibacillus aquaticus]|uniref:Segregation and condensation protein B n=1 Tax=Fictibacillus aquaticus TaxID=2021314 RepID=A0A235FBT3_9BACL|nr:SMC-Scp complex subunit ScpB [Fictibacillus aquaticus]OYD58407.1 SMC-Scp complex subunit ScpB [Fictibacillus aquaticus]